MIVRIIALILLFALAVPATAMPLCHGEAQAEAMHDGHGKPAKPHQDNAGKHGCLACAAPMDRDSVAPSAQNWDSATPIAPMLASLHGLIPTPEPPPPRA